GPDPAWRHQRGRLSATTHAAWLPRPHGSPHHPPFALSLSKDAGQVYPTCFNSVDCGQRAQFASPSIKACFLARLQFLLLRSAVSASSRVPKLTIETRATSLRGAVYLPPNAI